MTKEQILKRLRDHKAKAKGLKPYKYDDGMIAADLHKRYYFNSRECETIIPEHYLSNLSYVLGIPLKRMTVAERNRLDREKKEFVEQSIENTIKAWNKLFLYPIVLKRGYA
jgi:hypothetical protein